jgi:hypothetical protein
MGGLTPAALDRALAAAVEAARAAGKIALGYYHGSFEVIIKPDQTPVTQADREAEQAIAEILRAAFPEAGVLGEEFGAHGATERRWIVDPIDGTKNFVRKMVRSSPESSTTPPPESCTRRGGAAAPIATASGCACPTWARSIAPT